MKYRYNPYCPCSRCRAHGYMWPAVLITLGVLFLLDQVGGGRWMDFGFTWPALLIVIGLLKLLQHSSSPEAHIPREYGATVPPNAVPYGGATMYPVQPQSGVVTPPPPTRSAGAITSGSSVEPTDREVQNG